MFSDVLYVCMSILTGMLVDAFCTTDKHFYTLGGSAGLHCGTMPKISSSVGTHEYSGPCASGTDAESPGETVHC